MTDRSSSEEGHMTASDAADAPARPAHVRARRMSRDQRREQLLYTALRVFSDGGYNATSMDEIAAAAGAVSYTHLDVYKRQGKGLGTDLADVVAHEHALSLIHI